MGRGVRMFRGSELPRLVLLAAIALVGWLYLVRGSLFRAPPRPVQQPPVQAERLPKIEPDTSPAFKGLLDKQPLNLRDNAAYSTLLTRARETPQAELARKSRREILYTHLWETPELYRGVPVHLEGTARKALTYEVGPGLSPKERLYEIWMFTPESGKNPYAVVCENLPEGFTIGADVNERVIFDGYFLKLMAYQAGDVPRAAPLLVGRLTRVHYSQFDQKDNAHSTLNWLMIALTLLTIYALMRWGFHLRSRLLPKERRKTSTPTDTIEPEALNDWLEQEDDDRFGLPIHEAEDEE